MVMLGHVVVVGVLVVGHSLVVVGVLVVGHMVAGVLVVCHVAVVGGGPCGHTHCSCCCAAASSTFSTYCCIEKVLGHTCSRHHFHRAKAELVHHQVEAVVDGINLDPLSVDTPHGPVQLSLPVTFICTFLPHCEHLGETGCLCCVCVCAVCMCVCAVQVIFAVVPLFFLLTCVNMNWTVIWPSCIPAFAWGTYCNTHIV